jgi:hypothetical protein
MGQAPGRLARLVVIQGDRPGPWTVQRLTVDGVSALRPQGGIYDGAMFSEHNEGPQPLEDITIGPASVIELAVSNLSRMGRMLGARVFVDVPGADPAADLPAVRLPVFEAPRARLTPAEVTGLVQRGARAPVAAAGAAELGAAAGFVGVDPSALELGKLAAALGLCWVRGPNGTIEIGRVVESGHLHLTCAGGETLELNAGKSAIEGYAVIALVPPPFDSPAWVSLKASE